MQKTSKISKPSQTQDGKIFIGRFSTEDQKLVTLLVDSLEIRALSHILNSLREELLRTVDAGGLDSAVLIPIRSREDLPKIEEPADHIAYKTFSPGDGFSGLSGSETEIGSVVAALVDEEPSRFLPPTTSFEAIREQKIKNIILVTDYCGSGNQAMRFARSFTSNPSLASWISSGRLNLRVLSYASSKDAISLFSGEKGISFSTLVAAKSGPAANWTEAEARGIEELCFRYSSEGAQTDPLGYKNSFGLYLSSYRVPNNLPQILTRSEGPWPGLFAARRVPVAFENELPTYIPQTSASQVLRNLGETELANFIDAVGRPFHLSFGLIAMSLLSRGKDEYEVRHLIGQEEDAWRRLKATLIALGLVNIRLELTDLGRREIKRSRLWSERLGASKRPDAVFSVDYSPSQLR